jgi:NAD(P)-dependent dehydrogenase (short-subunit alcohol dehydrogenase family)
LITGGDSGIGRAVAIAFAKEGAEVAINYLPEEEPDAQDLADFFETRLNKTLHRIPGDLLDEDFCADLVEQADEALNGLDILVNNAG